MFGVEFRRWVLILSATALCVAVVSCEGETVSKGDKKQFLKEVDLLEDPSEKRAELEAYITRNPDGPQLSFAYGLLLDLLRTEHPQDALRLADRILTEQKTDTELHYYAYLTKFTVYEDLGDRDAAAALARRVLTSESDPNLLRLASPHDPEKAEEYEARIQSSLINSQEIEAIGWESRLYDLSPSDLKKMSDEDRARRLTQQIRSYEALPESDRALTNKFPALYYEISDVLARLGDGESALSYLERVKEVPGLDSHLDGHRGEVYERLGKPLLAIEAFTQALALNMNPWLWQRIQELCESVGESPEKWLARSRQIRAERRWTFPDLNLETPDSQKRNLHDFLGSDGSVVVFFSPG